METSFGNWVRRRRKALDLTQDNLAGRVGCSTSAIYKIEADERRPSRQIAELLATHLEIPTDQRALFIKIARMEKAVDALGDFPPFEQPLLPISTGLPLSSKPLVGREYELAEITRLIMQPECRLLTLIGPGGIGKTHLVMVLADQFGRGSHQYEAAFVNLAPVTDREQTVTAIATALGIVLYSASDRSDQLIAYLRSRNLLLILDNFEHLSVEAGCIDLISSIMRGTEKIKLMMTSRQPLQLQNEWVFEVQGLPVPESSDPHDLISNSAESLFIQRAQQVQAGFRPTDEDLLAIAQICKLVEGLPLGIELAATWVRTLSCQGIAEEIQQSIYFLETEMYDLPERHRSIRATIDYSWKRLSNEEQKVLRELSIFSGGFRREAAERVAGARLTILSALISKSLVRRAEAGRYEMHSLIQQYAWERLQEKDTNSQVWQRYSQYYANLLAQRGLALKGIDRTSVVAELIEELPNLRRAWQWISEHQQAQEINLAADTLFWLYESRSNCREGVRLFDEAVQCLQNVDGYRSEPNRFAHQLALGQALCYKGYFLYRQGQHPQGREAISSSLQILETLPVQEDEARLIAISNAKAFLGTVTAVMGDFGKGDSLMREALAMKQRLNDLWGAAFCLRQIGLFAFHYQGDYEQASQTLQQSYLISKQIQNAWSIAASLSQLGLVSYDQGHYPQAEQYLTEALGLSRVLEDRASIAFALDCLGPVKMAQSQEEEGLNLLQESIALWEEIGEKGSLAQTLIHSGAALIKMGRPVEAQKEFLDALQIASELQTLPVLLEALLGYAEVQAEEGHMEKAFEVVTAVKLNPSNSFEARSRAELLETKIAKKLPAPLAQDIQARSSSIKLADLVQTILSTDRIPL